MRKGWRKWRDIKGYESLYQISRRGEIKSLITGIILRRRFQVNGYEIATLCNKNKNPRKQTYRVHRLVAEHFISNPNNFPEVHHKNENKRDNNVKNLKWITKKENFLLSTNKMNKTKHRVLIKNQILEIRELRKLGWLHKQLAEKFKVTREHITNILNNKRRNIGW
jgi:hypothetical protein